MVQRNNFSCILIQRTSSFIAAGSRSQKYFRFALQITRGEKEYVWFNIMVYGFELSVAVVTRLIKLLQGLLHEAGLSTLMTAKYWAAPRMKSSRTWRSPPFQLVGWNICTMERTSQVTGSQSGCEVPHGRPLLPDPARTPGPFQPKKFSRWRKKQAASRPPPKSYEKMQYKIFVTNFWANFLPIIGKIRPQL